MSLIIIYRSIDSDSFLKSAIQPSIVEYHASINGRIALCKLVQKFIITLDGIEEGVYQFPVDYNSAFCDLLIKTPREDIRGCVKEKKEAKTMYNKAKSEGKQAFLTEETDDDRDIYKLSMCNLLYRDEITVEYTYITEVEFMNGKNIFYIPSFISPRYGGNFIPNGNHQVKCSLKIRDNVSTIRCSMPDTVIYTQEHATWLVYNCSEVIEKDIEVMYDTDFVPKAMQFTINDYKMAIAQFEPKIDGTKNIKELMFILDCSGSMKGERINNSKRAICHCLEQLKNSGFLFNIMRYGSKHEIYLPEPLPASEENIRKAVEYCQNINADLGGTETYNALKACLDVCKTAILITDGDTSANDEIHKLCKQFDCLSVLGIGSGINRANIRDMAKIGSGIACFSQNETTIVQNMNLVFNNIGKAVINNPVYNWHSKLSSVAPIISDQPNVVYAILDQNTIVNELMIEGLDIVLDVEPYSGEIDAQYLGCLVAKRIIQDNESLPKEKLIDLAVKFNIITKYTSMIAISSLEGRKPIEEDGIQSDAILMTEESIQYLCAGPMYMQPETFSREGGLRIGSIEKSALFDDAKFDLKKFNAAFDILHRKESSIEVYEYNGVENLSTAKRITNAVSSFGNIAKTKLTSALASMRTKISRTTSNRNIPEIDSKAASMISDGCIVFIPPTENSDEEADDIYNDPVELDDEQIRLSLEWISNYSLPIQTRAEVMNYFNRKTGFFHPDIRKVFDGLPDSLLANECALTLFVLLCLRKTFGLEKIYKECYDIAMKNSAIMDLATKVGFETLLTSALCASCR